MIKELENITLLPSNSPLLTKYFFKRKKNRKTILKEELMKRKLITFYHKVYHEDNYYQPFNYLDNYGYYRLKPLKQGKYYHVYNYGENINKAFIELIKDDLWGESNAYESDYHGSLVQRIEYILDKWDKYYNGKLPEEIISYYENYLNNNQWTKDQNVIWTYDKETKKITCQKIQTKKLERIKNERRYQKNNRRI